MDWINLAQDRDRLKALMNTVMYLRVQWISILCFPLDYFKTQTIYSQYSAECQLIND
jgi:hypothetical protein